MYEAKLSDKWHALRPYKRGYDPDVITGTAAPPYSDDNSKCRIKDGSKHGATLDCKYETAVLETFCIDV